MLNKKLVSFKVFRNFFPLLFLLWKTEKSFVVKNSWNSRGNHSYINSGISSLWTHAIHPMLCDFIFFSFLSYLYSACTCLYSTERADPVPEPRGKCSSNTWTQETNYNNIRKNDPWIITLHIQARRLKLSRNDCCSCGAVRNWEAKGHLCAQVGKLCLKLVIKAPSFRFSSPLRWCSPSFLVLHPSITGGDGRSS